MSTYYRTPTATVRLNGQRWRAILTLGTNQQFGEKIATGSILGRDPPTTPQIGMSISWTWGYGGVERAGVTGEVSDTDNTSYPGRWALQVKDVLFRADKSKQVIVTDPLNEITARAAIIYILTHYGGIPSSRLNIPALNASGSAWAGSEWVLGVRTPVQWGDPDTDSGGSSALDAAVEICSCLGYWLYADASGIVRAKQMERKPSTSAREVFQRGVNLLVSGAPERKQSYDSIYNQVSVRGANTGVDGAQIVDQFRTTHPLLPAGVYRDKPFSSFLIEYVNESEAGAASATATAKRQLNVASRIPDVETHRAKADPNRTVGDTVGLIDPAVGLSGQKNYFIYSIARTLDLQKGAFDDQLVLDGGTGSTGYTTIPPPDASFSWTLDAETLDGTAVVVVALDGSGSTSPTGEIVSYAWSTDATPYGGTAASATGMTALLVFEAADSPVNVTLTVTDTTSKTGTFTPPSGIDLTGADTQAPIQRVISIAFGAAWAITPDGGATVDRETSNGDAVAVPPYGAGIDGRAPGTATTYGLLATRGSGGAGGVRQTLDMLASVSTNLASATGAITCMWVNEANPARVWWAVGDTIYRSLDGGTTATAMATPNAGTDVGWIIEDPAVENSVFAACGADLYNTTDPTSGWALLYPGPAGATARQFVRSRDGQVTWVCYVGSFTGGAAQRVETGAVADIAAAEIRTLALNKDASNLKATLTLIDATDPAQIYHVDGLTGLSAVTSPATFPAGATVMHMLPDPDIDLYYCADFDSVAPGTGAVRKLIADQLLLMLAGETGQQAHMLGFGGRAIVPGRVILIPFEASGAGDFIWVHDTVGWVGRTPPQAGWAWVQLVANPFDGDEWLLYGRSPNSANPSQRASVQSGIVRDLGATGESPLYRTTNAGATWTAVDLTSAAADGSQVLVQAKTIEWSDSESGAWLLTMGAEFIAANPTQYWRGSHSSAGTAFLEGAPNYWVLGFVASGINGQFIVAGRFNSNRLYVIETDGTRVDVDPTDAGEAYLGIDKFPGTGSPVVVGLRNINTLVAAEDYRDAQPSESLVGAGTAITAAIDGVYVGGRTGVLRVANVLGGASGTVVAADGVGIGFIRAARQNRALATVVAARASNADSYIYDGTTWTFLPGPANATTVVDYVEVTGAT